MSTPESEYTPEITYDPALNGGKTFEQALADTLPIGFTDEHGEQTYIKRAKLREHRS